MEVCAGDDCGCCCMEDVKNWVIPLLPLRNVSEQQETRRYAATIYFFPRNLQLQK